LDKKVDVENTQPENNTQPEKKMTFLDHLEELRMRLIRIAIVIAIGMAISYIKIDLLLKILLKPACGLLIYISPVEAFVVQLKVALVSGLIITLPYTSFEIWGFISPALYRKEKRFAIPFVVSFITLFAIGVFFAYLLLPYAMKFFRSFEGETLKATWTISKYMDFLIKMFLGFGLVFETPIIVFFLARMGVLSPQTMISKWKYFVISIFIVAAFVTPGPDIFSQLVLALPLTLLYLLSILIAKIAYKEQE